jgi:transcriptional regulator with XRE-family HTH domain
MPVTLQDKLAKLAPERREKVERRAAELHEEEMTLRELRKAHALTQTAMAEKLGVKQASVARIEQRSDLLLSPLRGYVEAMGGALESVARLPNRRPVRLREIGELDGTRAGPGRSAAEGDAARRSR